MLFTSKWGRISPGIQWYQNKCSNYGTLSYTTALFDKKCIFTLIPICRPTVHCILMLATNCCLCMYNRHQSSLLSIIFYSRVQFSRIHIRACIGYYGLYSSKAVLHRHQCEGEALRGPIEQYLVPHIASLPA